MVFGGVGDICEVRDFSDETPCDVDDAALAFQNSCCSISFSACTSFSTAAIFPEEEYKGECTFIGRRGTLLIGIWTYDMSLSSSSYCKALSIGVVITFSEGVREGCGVVPSDWDVSSSCLDADLLRLKGRVTLAMRGLAFGFTSATRRLGDLRRPDSPLGSRAVNISPSSPNVGTFSLFGHPSARL